MNLIREYTTGYNNFRKLTHTIKNPIEGMNTFSLEIIDVETRPFNNILEVFADSLSNAGKQIEVLYSGGMDSEVAIKSCLLNKIPVTATTLRLNLRGSPINTHDLYYSEKFCRSHGIKQNIVDLNIEPFYNNGVFLDYLRPYNITAVHVATHFYLLEQCTNFAVIGGDWPWPHVNNKAYSPQPSNFAYHDIFMRDRSIDGIGNFLGNSLESCLYLIGAHVDVATEQGEGATDIKQKIFERLGLGTLEARHRSYGWESVRQFRSFFYIHGFTRQAWKEFNFTQDTIIWNNKLAEAINGNPGSNSYTHTFIEKKVASVIRDIFHETLDTQQT